MLWHFYHSCTYHIYLLCDSASFDTGSCASLLCSSLHLPEINFFCIPFIFHHSSRHLSIMHSSDQTHAKNIFDFFLSDKRTRAGAKAGLNDTLVYKASLESPLNGHVNWDWPFPTAIVPAARNRNPVLSRPTTDHLELSSSMYPTPDTSFTDPTVIPSQFCENIPYLCDPVAAQEFYNTTFDSELIALLNDVTAVLAALDTDSSSTTADHTFAEASIPIASTSLDPSFTSLVGATDSIPTSDPPIIDLFTPSPETGHDSVPMARTTLDAAPNSSFQGIDRSMIITPPYYIDSIDLTDSPPNSTAQIGDVTPVGEAKRAIFVPNAKSHASVASEPANDTTKLIQKAPQKRTPAQRKPRANTPKRCSTPTSSSPRVLRRIAPTPPASVNYAVFKTPQEASPKVPLNPITPMSIETQQRLYEEKYLGQQNIYGNQQQHLKRMNQKFQDNLRQEQINREQHLNQGRQQQQYQQIPHFTQLPQATQLPQLMQSSQSAKKEPERDHYPQHLQQARQRQARKQLPLSMQTFQASQQLMEDESHLEHLRLARQQRAHQSIQTFMSDPHKMEHEQHLYNMQLANQQRQYLVSPQSPQTPQPAQQQMDHKIHLQQLQQAHEQQAHQEHARRQLPQSFQTLHPAQQQMAHEQHLRYLQYQNQTRQQQQYQQSPRLFQPIHPPQLNQLSQSSLSPRLPQLVYPPQQMQVAPPMRVARQAGPAYGTSYPNQQLQAVPQGQAAYLTLPNAQQCQSAVSASPFYHGASHNLPIDRMPIISPAPSSKRSFVFVDNAANPDNHDRWFIPDTKRKEKTYLNGPHSKKSRLALEE
jgi:hypothetical protein